MHQLELFPVAHAPHYGCHSTVTRDLQPRGVQTTYTVRTLKDPESHFRSLTRIVSDWLPIACGYDERQNDPQCADCVNQRR